MKIKLITFAVLMVLAAGALVSSDAQKRRSAPAKPAQRGVVFAVLNDGSVLEPIGYVDAKGVMTQAIDGSSEGKVLTAFHRGYFSKGKIYSLIFGGKSSGTVTVASSDPAGECVNYLARATTTTTRSPLKGNVMALATNLKPAKPTTGVRRMPTPAERAEIENLVRDVYKKNGVEAAGYKDMRYHNLTALDVDSDGIPEFVGTFWAELSPKDRGLLFFIASRAGDGKYAFSHSEYRKIAQDDTMSGDIADVDTGVYHERLLDVLDVDNDGVAEIFTYVMSFESAGFNVYKRAADGWKLHFDGGNYHCGY